MALASALRWVARRSGCAPLLVHVDHRLRPASSDEARRALMLAEALTLPCLVEPLPVPPQERHPGVGIEEAARRERYRILIRVARKVGAFAVATGHHREDQAESALLHLMRGAGLHGAAAMAEVAPAPEWGPEARDISPKVDVPMLWRPLLRESRDDIRRYLGQLGLEPIHDPSNEDRALRRNVVRHEVLPLLESHFPGAAAAIARYAELAAADDALLDDLSADALVQCVHQGGVLDATCLGLRPHALQRRMARRWLATSSDAPAPTLNRTDAILSLARAGAGGRAVEIGEGWTVRLERGMLRVVRVGDSG